MEGDKDLIKVVTVIRSSLQTTLFQLFIEHLNKVLAKQYILN